MGQERVYSEKFREQIESCYSCGQCEFYCPFFPRAFSLLEEEEQYGREGLLGDAYEGLLELCYDCKLCKIACPFKYDLPHIVIRAKANVMKREGLPWIKKIYSEGVLNLDATYCIKIQDLTPVLPLCNLDRHSILLYHSLNEYYCLLKEGS